MCSLFNFVVVFRLITSPQTPNDTTQQLQQLYKQTEGQYYANIDSALHLAKASVRLATQTGRPQDVARSLNHLSKAYYIKGDYYGSLAAANQALSVSGKNKDVANQANATNSRGLIFMAQDRLTDAINEFKRAAALNLKVKNYALLDANYFNIGICYDELGRYAEAMHMLNQAEDVAEQTSDWHIMLMTLNRKGEVNYHLHKYAEALEYYEAAIAYKRYQDDWETTFARAGMAQTLLAMNQPEAALPQAIQSFKIAQRLKVAWDIRRAADILAQCHAALKNFQQAYTFQRQAQQWADSLLNEGKERKINELHLKQKEDENSALMKVNASSQSIIKRNSIIITAIGLLVVLLTIALIYLRRVLKHRNKLNLVLRQNYDAIALQNEELKFHRTGLIASNQAKDQVLSVLGHDLRAPFSTALQSIELIRNDYLDKDEQQKVLNGFEQQLTHLGRLLNDLFEWAGSKQAGKPVSIETLDLIDIMTETLGLYASALENKEITLKHNVAGKCLILVDRARLRICLQNIIANSIKFTERGGVVEIHYTAEYGMTAVHISDSGVGMSKEKQERLFKYSGYQISEQGTEQEPGTGLGLLLVKQLLDETQGKVRIKSQEGKGSEFMLLFETAADNKIDPGRAN